MATTPMGTFVVVTTPIASRASTIVLTPPLGLPPGASLLYFGWSGETNDSRLTTSVLPPGWAVLSDISTVTRQQVILLRRKVTDNEPLTHVFSMTATGGGFALVGLGVVYAGLDASLGLVAVGVTDIPANTNSFSCPALTLAHASDLYLGFVADHSLTATATTPALTNERLDIANSASHTVVFDLQAGIAGQTSAQVVSLSVANNGVAVAYVLAAAPIPTPATPAPGDPGYMDHGAAMLARLPEQFKARRTA